MPGLRGSPHPCVSLSPGSQLARFGGGFFETVVSATRRHILGVVDRGGRTAHSKNGAITDGLVTAVRQRNVASAYGLRGAKGASKSALASHHKATAGLLTAVLGDRGLSWAFLGPRWSLLRSYLEDEAALEIRRLVG
jgi:hypothetical protein